MLDELEKRSSSFYERIIKTSYPAAPITTIKTSRRITEIPVSYDNKPFDKTTTSSTPSSFEINNDFYNKETSSSYNTHKSLFDINGKEKFPSAHDSLFDKYGSFFDSQLSKDFEFKFNVLCNKNINKNEYDYIFWSGSRPITDPYLDRSNKSLLLEHDNLLQSVKKDLMDIKKSMETKTSEPKPDMEKLNKLNQKQEKGINNDSIKEEKLLQEQIQNDLTEEPTKEISLKNSHCVKQCESFIQERNNKIEHKTPQTEIQVNNQTETEMETNKIQAETEINNKIQAETEINNKIQAETEINNKIQAETKNDTLKEMKFTEKEEEAELQKMAIAKAVAEVQSKVKAISEAIAEAQAKAHAEIEAQAMAKLEAIAKAEVEAEALEKAEAETKAKAEAETKAKAEAEAKAKAKKEAEALAKAIIKAKAKAKAKAESEADAEAKAIAKLIAKSNAKVKPKPQIENEFKIENQSKEGILEDDLKFDNNLFNNENSLGVEESLSNANKSIKKNSVLKSTIIPIKIHYMEFANSKFSAV